MIKDLPFFRILKNQKVSVREMFHLKDYDEIDKIIIKVHPDYPDGKVKCTIIGEEEEGVVIDNLHAFLHGYGRHDLSSFRLNVRSDTKLDCIVECLETENAVISISIKLK